MATMASIPAGLSFLASMASQYPPFQKAMQGVSVATAAANATGFQFPSQPGPNPPAANPSVVQPPVNQPNVQPPTQPQTSSAPVNIPQVTPSSGHSSVAQTPASSPPTGAHATSSRLCEVTASPLASR
jgi:hypothetical protein